MADDNKKPTSEEQADAVTDDELKEITADVSPPDEYPEGQAEALEEALEEAGGDGELTAVEEGVTEALRATEEAQDTAPVQAFDSAVSGIQAAIESIPGAPEEPHDAHAQPHLSDTTVLFGREIPYPIYTVVFFALGALTILEVLMAELLVSVEIIKIPLLLSIAIAKSALVVIFYMHLNHDSRVFAVTFLVPVAIALLSVLFLLGIPAN